MEMMLYFGAALFVWVVSMVVTCFVASRQRLPLHVEECAQRGVVLSPMIAIMWPVTVPTILLVGLCSALQIGAVKLSFRLKEMRGE